MGRKSLAGEGSDSGSGRIEVGPDCEGCGCDTFEDAGEEWLPVVRADCGCGCPGLWLCPGCWVECSEAAQRAGEPLCETVAGWRVMLELRFPRG
ncbi:MAG TPA: hypothetical protein VMZ50_09935 [Phycisphaerae bacterium]|nr:hypothetical protein [Phycisphaerae bacterium]